MPYSWPEEFLANLLMMAGESKTEVQGVVISDDDNSQDTNSERIVRNKSPQNIRSRRWLPPHNVPEKIFLCLDVSSSCSKILLAEDRGVEPLLLLKQCLFLFIHNKLSWSPQSEIAIILLNGSSVFFYNPLTNKKKEIIDRIKRINVRGGGEDSDMEGDLETPFCLDEIFKTIAENVELPVPDNINIIPLYIVRCVFFYSRTKLLSFSKFEESFKYLINSPYFTFDTIFLHDCDLDDKIRTEILKGAALLDKGYSYILESDNNVINFMNTFSLLVSHPLQRPHQSEVNHDVAFYKKMLS